MTRDELRRVIDTEYQAIINLFGRKNWAYGSSEGEDAFYNFRQTASRIWGNIDTEHQFKVLLTYMDKHLLALATRGISDPEYKERLRDIIVYCFIALAMINNE